MNSTLSLRFKGLELSKGYIIQNGTPGEMNDKASELERNTTLSSPKLLPSGEQLGIAFFRVTPDDVNDYYTMTFSTLDKTIKADGSKQFGRDFTGAENFGFIDLSA